MPLSKLNRYHPLDPISLTRSIVECTCPWGVVAFAGERGRNLLQYTCHVMCVVALSSGNQSVIPEQVSVLGIFMMQRSQFNFVFMEKKLVLVIITKISYVELYFWFHLIILFSTSWRATFIYFITWTHMDIIN